MQDENYILFESYLSKNMSKDEIAAFEFRLEREPDFAEAFNVYKELSYFLGDKFKNESASNIFQNNLEKISNAHFNKEEVVSKSKKPTKTFPFYKYAIAACVVALFGVFTFNQFSNPTYSDFNDYNAISFTVRGENDELLQTAENAFNNKNFSKAEETFKSLIELYKNNAELKIYQAISNIELNNFEKAESLLIEIKKGNSAYKNKAIWYLALSKLKQKNNKASLEILKTIPKDADHYKQAQKLIKKLD